MARRFRRGLGWWLGGGLLAIVCIALTPRVGHASDAIFPTPDGLEPAVRFWLDTFTRWDHDDVVIHDRVEPGMVYDVVHGVADDDDPRVRARVSAVVEWLQLTTQRAARRLFFLPPSAAVDPVTRVRTQRGARDSIAQGIVAERLFHGVVRRALADEGLPPELAALPLVESSYHPGLTSSARAVGLWQLTTDVADRWLRIDGKVDERRDPARASSAAASYLHELYDAFKSWPLALTAYNHGPTGVQRAREGLGTDDLGEIVRRWDGPGFGFASRSFYAEFLAARQVLRGAATYFPDLAAGRMVTYKVKRGDTLERVARQHGVTIPSLRVTNGIRSAMIRPGQVLLVRL
jgi:membrane-bound lytic murein transglycosylase D